MGTLTFVLKWYEMSFVLKVNNSACFFIDAIQKIIYLTNLQLELFLYCSFNIKKASCYSARSAWDLLKECDFINIFFRGKIFSTYLCVIKHFISRWIIFYRCMNRMKYIPLTIIFNRSFLEGNFQFFVQWSFMHKLYLIM